MHAVMTKMGRTRDHEINIDGLLDRRLVRGDGGDCGCIHAATT